MRKQSMKGGKYYKLLLGIMSGTIIASIVILYLTVLMNARGHMTDWQNQVERNVMQQLEHNVEQINDMAVGTLRTVYKDPSAALLMYGDERSMNEILLAYVRLRRNQYLPNDTFLHSIAFYNAALDEFYNISSGTVPLNDRNSAQVAFIQGTRGTRGSRPFYCEVVDGGAVFTYYIVENDGNALFVCTSADYLLDSVASMSDERNDTYVFLFDAYGEQIRAGGEPDELATWGYAQTRTESALTAHYDGVDYALTSLAEPNSGVTILRVRSQRSLGALMRVLWVSTTLSTVIVSAVALMMVYIASHYLYRPVNRTLRSVRFYEDEDEYDMKDEFGALDRAYNDAQTELLDLRASERKMRRLHRERLLSRLLTGESKMTEDETERAFSETGIRLDPRVPVLVLITRQSDYEEQMDYSMHRTVSLLLSEWLSKSFVNEWIEKQPGTSVFILNVKPDQCESVLDVCAIVARLNDYLRQNDLPLVLGAVGSAPVPFARLHGACRSAQANLDYRFIYAADSGVLTDFEVNRNRQNVERHYSQALSDELEQALESGDAARSCHLVELIFNQIARLSYEHAVFCSAHLSEEIGMKLSKLHPGFELEPDLTDIASGNIRTLQSRLNAGIRSCLESRDEPRSIEQAIAQTVAQYIDAHFADNALCLSSIADALSLPSRQVSRLYRVQYGVSVNDGITGKRLAIAAKRLRETAMPVGEIARSVGVDNETYFYSLFKKRYHATPKEYALNVHLKQMNGKEEG